MISSIVRVLKLGILSGLRVLGYGLVKLPPRTAGVAAILGSSRDGATTASPTDGDAGLHLDPFNEAARALPRDVLPGMPASSDAKPGPKNPALKSLRLNMHHVGGRGGGFPMPVGARFHDGTEMYIYDADPDCGAQMESASAYVDHVVVAAVGREDSKAEFYVNYDPYTSSLLPAQPDNTGIFYQDANCDYILQDVLKPLKKIAVETKTLASLARQHGFQVDYLSLDVQGAEFDILAGAGDDILRDTVGIMCEISLLQFYDKQRLFDEITALLRPKGFFVANVFPHGYDWATYRAAIGWRGRGFMAHGDVLFLRDPQNVVESATRPFASLLKMAFVAVCYGNIAYALQCLELAYKNPEEDVVAAGEEISYIRFLDEMYRLYQNETHIFPPRFSHLWTAAESVARFNEGEEVVRDIETIRGAYFLEEDRDAFSRIAPRLLDPTPTAFEVLLGEFGFQGPATDVRERRITSMKQTLGALGLKLEDGQIKVASLVS